MLRALLLALLLAAAPLAGLAAEPAPPESQGGMLARSEFEDSGDYVRSGPLRQSTISVQWQDYVDGRLADLRRELTHEISLRAELQQVAIEKAEAATAIHFTTINGLNQRLEEQQKTFVTREESTAALEAIRREIVVNAERISAIELKLERMAGAASISDLLWGMGVAIMLSIIAGIGSALAFRSIGKPPRTAAGR